MRLIDDFLANSGVGKCQDFKETMDVISKVGRIAMRLLCFFGMVGMVMPVSACLRARCPLRV